MADREGATPGAEPSPGGWSVRPAVPDDAPRIWEMILGLATSERLQHEVTGSPARLAEHLFGPAPRVECLVATSGKGLAGYALFYPTYSSFRTMPTLWLEDLYVEPEQRGRGAGRTLLAELARLALRRGCDRVGWVVLDWNRPSIDFYAKAGAAPTGGGWLQYGLDRRGLVALARSPSASAD